LGYDGVGQKEQANVDAGSGNVDPLEFRHLSLIQSLYAQTHKSDELTQLLAYVGEMSEMVQKEGILWVS
jgi:hypothetical protein